VAFADDTVGAQAQQNVTHTQQLLAVCTQHVASYVYTDKEKN